MSAIPRRWLWAVPALTMAAGLFSVAGLRRTQAAASSQAGAAAFSQYGMGPDNNPVFEDRGVSHWDRNWTYTAQEPLQQASVAHGAVYVSGDGGRPHDPHNDEIYALGAGTGKVLWTRHLDNMSMTTPVVAHGLVFVGTGNQQFSARQQAKVNRLQSRSVVRGTGPSAIYALGAHTGAVRWKFPTRGEDMPTLVADHSMVYAANGQGRIYALAAPTGAVQWSLKIGSYVSMASPVLMRGILYVSGAHPYKLYAVDVHTHRLVWERPVPGVFGGSDDSSPAVAGGLIYLEGTTGTWQHPVSELLAFRTSGTLAWETRLGAGTLPKDIEVSAPMEHRGTVYVGSPVSDAEYAVQARTGRVQWRFKAYGPISESAAAVRGRVYVGDGKGMLYALNAKSGREIWSRYLSGAFAADYPVVVGQTLYQPDENGQMFALPMSKMTGQALRQPPRLPMPSGALGQDIKKGEGLFMEGMGRQGQSCASCHAGGGSLSTYRQGQLIPSLLGAASAFPMVRQGKIRTLDGQIRSCLHAMRGPQLAADSVKMQELNVYLHWLSSGWPDHLSAQSGHSHSKGGC